MTRFPHMPTGGGQDERYVVVGGDLLVVLSDQDKAALQREAMLAANLDVEVHVMSAATWQQVRDQLAASHPDITITDLTA
ncbi:hypothetical protein [Actinopolymorpha sp. B9G3]|uniref:hypothetical protein n=1 Tax=Actinopolymorpha sp. B9G3 TaxID=3158970 RepID=UPI0032D8EBEE